MVKNSTYGSWMSDSVLLAFAGGVITSAATGMEVTVQAHEAFFLHMGINLRGSQIGMPQHILNHTQVGSILEQVGSEGMTHDMRVHIFRQSYGSSTALNNLAYALAGKRRTAIGKEERSRPATGVQQLAASLLHVVTKGGGSHSP